MALINCRECGKQVASSAKICPHCGITTPNKSSVQGALIGKLLIAGLFGWAVYSCSQTANNGNPSTAGDGHLDALYLCQQAIRQVAKNPSSAHVPYATDRGTAAEHYFAWPKGSGLTMMNAFGANLDTSASCITTADGKTITSLTVDGKTIL
ncbi:hypothetical protein [Rhodanobacter sp. OR92]|uniref:hypothetical protein n=1 Tax=Rhodanobacter sp. OR92 TaxID=1076524 RepID=UPI0012DE0F60|nr:hypothetical protein [Rhodanobacter sp. OR92]